MLPRMRFFCKLQRLPGRGWFPRVTLAVLASVGGVSAFAQVQPTVCVEFPPTGLGNTAPLSQTTAPFVARFSYYSYNNYSQTIPKTSASNLMIPQVQPAGQPGQFFPGYHYGAVNVLVPAQGTETWYLTSSNVEAQTTSLICPIVLVPATLKYTAAGTYNNVYLGQVDSGPASAGVTVVAQPSAGITVSNLVYTPGDLTSPAVNAPQYEHNPNSIYGTVTVASGASASSSIALALYVNGTTSAQTIVPVAFTPPAYTITGSAVNGSQTGAGLTVASGSTLPISVVFMYSGAPMPTGAITIQVDGTGVGLSNQSCSYKTGGSSPRQNCSISYTASGPAGGHTLTFAQAGDSNFAAFSGSAAIQVTMGPAPSAEPIAKTPSR